LRRLAKNKRKKKTNPKPISVNELVVTQLIGVAVGLVCVVGVAGVLPLVCVVEFEVEPLVVSGWLEDVADVVGVVVEELGSVAVEGDELEPSLGQLRA
jgi:hypothetical protein